MPKLKLNSRQEAFAQHYALHRNATAAFKAAGYAYHAAKQATTHRRAIEVLQNPKVAARIEELIERVSERAGRAFDITADRILQELAAIGFANLQDFVAINEAGQPAVNLDDAQRHQWAALGELIIEQSDNGGRTVTRTRLKLLDKKGALVELAKLTGLFDGKSGHPSAPTQDAIEAASAELDDRIDQLLHRAKEACKHAREAHEASAWEH